MFKSLSHCFLPFLRFVHSFHSSDDVVDLSWIDFSSEHNQIYTDNGACAVSVQTGMYQMMFQKVEVIENISCPKVSNTLNLGETPGSRVGVSPGFKLSETVKLFKIVKNGGNAVTVNF